MACRILSTAARLLALSAAGTVGAAGLEDAAVLVQSQAESSSAIAQTLSQSRLGMLAGLAQMPQLPGLDQLPKLLQGVLAQLPTPTVTPPYNCSANPWMCEEPFNCQKPYLVQEALATSNTMATETGHANLRAWCAPDTAKYTDNLVRHCLKNKDLKTSGQKVYEATISGKFGPFTAEMDGSYCFIEGHCSNTAVTYNTTLEEAEKMCDARYGHKGWAKYFGQKDMSDPITTLIELQGGLNLKEGFKHTRITRMFLKAACAMGNYHCDVIYCRDTYCKEEYFIKKYGHLLPKAPGHLIQDQEWLD